MEASSAMREQLPSVRARSARSVPPFRRVGTTTPPSLCSTIVAEPSRR